MSQQIESFIHEADQLLIASHLSPDGDALGATLAVAQACKQLGKEVVCVNEGPIPARLAFLPGVAKIRHPAQVTGIFQHVITVDAADRTRIGEVERLIAPDAVILNIDHHVTNDAYGAVNVIDATASSTAEMIYRWITQSEHIHCDAALATCLYTGILTDTGGFRYANTTPAVLRAAADLLERGAVGSEIAEQSLDLVTLTQLQLQQKALATLQMDETGQIAWLSLTAADLQENGATSADVEGIVNLARNVVGVEVGIFFREQASGEIKVSFRSQRIIDVAQLAREWGGGGHARAAGCTILGALSDVTQQVVQRVAEEWAGEGQ